MLSEISFKDKLGEYIRENDWKKVLKFGDSDSTTDSIEDDVRRKFLWFWPTAECLMFMKSALEQLKLRNILSVGCGSGLLEWLIEKSTGMRIIGVEVDEEWWRSKYSTGSFIPLKFLTDELLQDFYANCFEDTEAFALLFCYFNNRPAFLDYVRDYSGNCIIIIGPDNQTATGRHTDPLPLTPEFETEEWCLFETFNFNIDVIAIYVRNIKYLSK